MTPHAAAPADAIADDALDAAPSRARLRLASGAGVSIALAVATVATSATAAHADQAYTVRPGDTVSHIAARTGTTVTAITRANAMADASRIRIGQVLAIPTTSAKTPAAAPAQAAARAAAPAASYAVASGDTVTAIAARFGTTVAAIRAANSLDSRAFIRVGQVLTIPSAAGATATTTVSAVVSAPAATTSYTVASGDTVSAIASRFGTTAAAISAANSLDSRAFIRIGQVLAVPTVAPAPSPTGTAALVGSTFAGRTYPAAVVASANANKATLLKNGAPTKAAMQSMVASTARSMGVDPSLALAIAHQESGFNHAAVSPANAIGTMQVIPSSGAWASEMVGRPLNLLDPQDNVVAGVAILRSLVRTGADLPTAIAGYYQGATSVKRDGMFADTRRYVASVQTLMSRYR